MVAGRQAQKSLGTPVLNAWKPDTKVYVCFQKEKTPFLLWDLVHVFHQDVRSPVMLDYLVVIMCQGETSFLDLFLACCGRKEENGLFSFFCLWSCFLHFQRKWFHVPASQMLPVVCSSHNPWKEQWSKPCKESCHRAWIKTYSWEQFQTVVLLCKKNEWCSC